MYSKSFLVLTTLILFSVFGTTQASFQEREKAYKITNKLACTVNGIEDSLNQIKCAGEALYSPTQILNAIISLQKKKDLPILNKVIFLIKSRRESDDGDFYDIKGRFMLQDSKEKRLVSPSEYGTMSNTTQTGYRYIKPSGFPDIKGDIAINNIDKTKGKSLTPSISIANESNLCLTPHNDCLILRYDLSKVRTDLEILGYSQISDIYNEDGIPNNDKSRETYVRYFQNGFQSQQVPEELLVEFLTHLKNKNYQEASNLFSQGIKIGIILSPFRGQIALNKLYYSSIPFHKGILGVSYDSLSSPHIGSLNFFYLTLNNNELVELQIPIEIPDQTHDLSSCLEEFIVSNRKECFLLFEQLLNGKQKQPDYFKKQLENFKLHIQSI